MENFSFKKFFIVVFICIAGFIYVKDHYDFSDAVEYAGKHPQSSLSPMITYYAGSAYYLRDDFDQAIKAYDQLLTQYPTCQYAPKALYRLGMAHQRKYHYSQAREAYEKYMKEFPEGDNIDMVRNRYDFVKFK